MESDIMTTNINNPLFPVPHQGDHLLGTPPTTPTSPPSIKYKRTHHHDQ